MEIKTLAQELTQDHASDEKKIEAIFMFVRDHIKYGLTKNGDFDSAEDTLESKIGQCNNKNNLFIALLRAAGFESRFHFGGIVKEIVRGLVSDSALKKMPPVLSHSWVEVKVNGQWKRIDTHILDHPLFLGAKKALLKKDWDLGFAVAKISIDDFILHDKLNPGTPIIPVDHGTWQNAADYYQSEKYLNKPTLMNKLGYKMMYNKINKTLNDLRT